MPDVTKADPTLMVIPEPTVARQLELAYGSSDTCRTIGFPLAASTAIVVLGITVKAGFDPITVVKALLEVPGVLSVENGVYHETRAEIPEGYEPRMWITAHVRMDPAPKTEEEQIV